MTDTSWPKVPSYFSHTTITVQLTIRVATNHSYLLKCLTSWTTVLTNVSSVPCNQDLVAFQTLINFRVKFFFETCTIGKKIVKQCVIERFHFGFTHGVMIIYRLGFQSFNIRADTKSLDWQMGHSNGIFWRMYDHRFTCFCRIYMYHTTLSLHCF